MSNQTSQVRTLQLSCLHNAFYVTKCVLHLESFSSKCFCNLLYNFTVRNPDNTTFQNNFKQIEIFLGKVFISGKRTERKILFPHGITLQQKISFKQDHIMLLLSIRVNGNPTLLVHCLYQMSPRNHKRTTSSLAPLIFYVAKKLAIK